MRESIITGLPLPESEGEAKVLASRTPAPRYSCCINCSSPFSSDNTHTAAGWRETQISGMCEDCFDDLFQEEAGTAAFLPDDDIPF